MPNHYIRRLLWLVAGMLVSAVGITMMLQANIGLEPWSVLQQGLAQTLGITYGTASMIVGAAAIGAAMLCGESFGFGTIINIILCAVFIDGLLWLGWIPQMHTLLTGLPLLLVGLELLALGTWMYMKSALGAGPRDALMVALARGTRPPVGPFHPTTDTLFLLPRNRRNFCHHRRFSARRAGRHRHRDLRRWSRLAVQHQFSPAAFPRG